MKNKDSKQEPRSGPRLYFWFLAIRPKTLFASIVPVVLGGVIAGIPSQTTLALTLLAALLLQIASNLANDVYDFEKGADSDNRLGPLRLTQAGLITSREMKFATGLCLGLALLIGVFLVFRGGLPILLFGLSSIVCAVAYTAGPLPIAYLGLGELFVLIFFGPVSVMGTYYLQTLKWSYESLLLGLACGSISCAILVVNNLRDYFEDKEANKRTLAVRFGREFARREYVFFLLLPSLILVILNIFFFFPKTIYLSLAYLLPAISCIKAVYFKTGKELNPVLESTGRLLAFFAVFFLIGYYF